LIEADDEELVDTTATLRAAAVAAAHLDAYGAGPAVLARDRGEPGDRETHQHDQHRDVEDQVAGLTQVALLRADHRAPVPRAHRVPR
jgi:hypothetical protein